MQLVIRKTIVQPNNPWMVTERTFQKKNGGTHFYQCERNKHSASCHGDLKFVRVTGQSCTSPAGQPTISIFEHMFDIL